MYSNTVLPVLGPIFGHASDGDARRRRLMLLDLASELGVRYQPIPRRDGFFLTCTSHPTDQGFSISGLHDQDYIHNHKKLVNHLHHASRNIKMGPYVVHNNFIVFVHDNFPFCEHGLSVEDILRNDRQNWASAQKVSFSKIRDCLEVIIRGRPGHGPDPSVTGTKIFLNIIWYYVEIFCSEKASLRDRIMYAGCVTHFLGIWRNWVSITEGMNHTKNFISRETYCDILISTHFATSLICYMSEQMPDSPCHLSLSGTDVCENFFSKNGQWVGNRHNYTFGRMGQNVGHMVRMEQIRVDPNAPSFAKPHPKGELIWSKQYTGEWQKADLTAYPSIAESGDAWREGREMAIALAKQASMLPQDGHSNEDNGDDPDNDDLPVWATHAFNHHGNRPADLLPKSNPGEDTDSNHEDFDDQGR